jgi:nitroreductase
MIHSLISNRRSPVLFSSRKITGADLLSLFDAARWAPSSRNQQPWRYIIASSKTPEEYLRLLKCLTEENKKWAHIAPVLGISIAERISDYDNKLNIYARHDVGLSTATLILQAMSIGIYVHIMGGFDPEMAIDSLSIPARFEPVAMFALGYPAEATEGFPQELIDHEKKERTRKNIGEILFYGKWEVKFNNKSDS